MPETWWYNRLFSKLFYALSYYWLAVSAGWWWRDWRISLDEMTL